MAGANERARLIPPSDARVPMKRKEGLRVVIEPIPGLTDKRVLTRQGFYFQCPPLEEFAWERTHSHTDYDTISSGQFSRRGGRQLKTLSFDTLFVDYGLYTLLDEDPDIEHAVEQLERVCNAGSPFLLTCAHQLPALGYDSWNVTLVGPEIQMPATLRSVRVSEKAGEPDARYVSLSFVEYRDPLVDRRRRGSRAGRRRFPVRVRLRADGRAFDENRQEIGRPPQDPVTLARLARHFYGDARKWRLIAEANRITAWGPNSALILHPRFRRGRHHLLIPSPAQTDADAPGRRVGS